MEGCFWKTLLVVGALTIGGSSSHKPLTYEEAAELAVSAYNSRSGEESFYRLLEVAPQPGGTWDPTSDIKQELNLTIQETECQKAEERPLEECDFLEGGAVLECTGYFFFGESPPVLVLTCVPVDEEEEEEEEGNEEVVKEEKEEDEKAQPRRVKRFKKFWRKLKNSVKKRTKKFFKKPKVIGVSIPF